MSVIIMILTATLAVFTLSGCAAAGSSPEAPGSMTVYLHGRTQAEIGVSTH